MRKDERWLCLDCGKNTFEGREDYYFPRNRLWRQLVPRHERHGMICRICIERRLGRPLTSEDFRKATDDESDPQDQPMGKEDYCDERAIAKKRLEFRRVRRRYPVLTMLIRSEDFEGHPRATEGSSKISEIIGKL
jgi:hypothetical protein